MSFPPTGPARGPSVYQFMQAGTTVGPHPYPSFGYPLYAQPHAHAHAQHAPIPGNAHQMPMTVPYPTPATAHMQHVSPALVQHAHMPPRQPPSQPPPHPQHAQPQPQFAASTEFQRLLAIPPDDLTRDQKNKLSKHIVATWVTTPPPTRQHYQTRYPRMFNNPKVKLLLEDAERRTRSVQAGVQQEPQLQQPTTTMSAASTPPTAGPPSEQQQTQPAAATTTTTTQQQEEAPKKPDTPTGSGLAPLVEKSARQLFQNSPFAPCNAQTILEQTLLGSSNKPIVTVMDALTPEEREFLFGTKKELYFAQKVPLASVEDVKLLSKSHVSSLLQRSCSMQGLEQFDDTIPEVLNLALQMHLREVIFQLSQYSDVRVDRYKEKTKIERIIRNEDSKSDSNQQASSSSSSSSSDNIISNPHKRADDDDGLRLRRDKPVVVEEETTSDAEGDGGKEKGGKSKKRKKDNTEEDEDDEEMQRKKRNMEKKQQKETQARREQTASILDQVGGDTQVQEVNANLTPEENRLMDQIRFLEARIPSAPPEQQESLNATLQQYRGELKAETTKREQREHRQRLEEEKERMLKEKRESIKKTRIKLTDLTAWGTSDPLYRKTAYFSSLLAGYQRQEPTCWDAIFQ
eukprot:TRINITY_DN67835_c4_g1_i1.p1 TRINITY_DN67835_c4_g1~~TRINITY_DN67835_c4_g1_i1.p1  ORF type:complete len:630 (+),score=87.22 TRINITY_DN67835_c4_g1_i1:21-1910(+)